MNQEGVKGEGNFCVLLTLQHTEETLEKLQKVIKNSSKFSPDSKPGGTSQSLASFYQVKHPGTIIVPCVVKSDSDIEGVLYRLPFGINSLRLIFIGHGSAKGEIVGSTDGYSLTPKNLFNVVLKCGVSKKVENLTISIYACAADVPFCEPLSVLFFKGKIRVVIKGYNVNVPRLSCGDKDGKGHPLYASFGENNKPVYRSWNQDGACIIPQPKGEMAEHGICIPETAEYLSVYGEQAKEELKKVFGDNVTYLRPGFLVIINGDGEGEGDDVRKHVIDVAMDFGKKTLVYTLNGKSCINPSDFLLDICPEKAIKNFKVSLPNGSAQVEKGVLSITNGKNKIVFGKVVVNGESLMLATQYGDEKHFNNKKFSSSADFIKFVSMNYNKMIAIYDVETLGYFRHYKNRDATSDMQPGTYRIRRSSRDIEETPAYAASYYINGVMKHLLIEIILSDKIQFRIMVKNKVTEYKVYDNIDRLIMASVPEDCSPDSYVAHYESFNA